MSMATDQRQGGDADDANASSAAPPPVFHDALHAGYISGLASKLDRPGSYEGAVTEHLRMSGIYWSLAALNLLRPTAEADRILGVTSPPVQVEAEAEAKEDAARESIVDFVFRCYDAPRGGFGGNVGHDAHLLYTLSALQILAMADRMDDPRLDRLAVVAFVRGLQQPDGSFAGDAWGEVDTRFSYCALSALSILGSLPGDGAEDGNSEGEEPCLRRSDVRRAAEYVASCRNFDGGFGSVPGAESHAGQVFCCVGALSIAKSLDLLDSDLLAWWLAERQCDSGGLNGRPEKQADVCYSWWILSALSILGRCDWINSDSLASFILRCQDGDDGGIADRPDDMPDVFHTFFGIAGLSLLGKLELLGDGYRRIDPVYALPSDVVASLGLGAQVMRGDDGTGMEGGTGDAGPLSGYDVYVPASGARP